MTSTPSGISAEADSSAAGSSFASSAFGASGVELAALPPLIKDEISSPSAPMIAKTESTGACPPSSTPTYNNVPFSYDSKS